MADLYRYRWRIHANSDEAPVARLMDLNGAMGLASLHLSDDDEVDVVGVFGLDLCVVGGWAEIEEVTNQIPPGREHGSPGMIGALYPFGRDCRGMPVPIPSVDEE